MLVQAVKEVGKAQDDVSIPTEPSTSKPHKKHKSNKQQPIAPKSAKVATATPIEDKEESFKKGRMIADMDKNVEDIDKEEPAEVEEVLEVAKAAKLMTEVNSKDKRKGILIEEPKRLKGQAQIDMDEAFTR
nr:hypothetical protein [Tanacetum cinerariifolium]